MCEEPNKVSVKDELWNKIQSRRKAKGLGYLKLKEDYPRNIEIKLSREEIERINLRRERNRIAAQRSRNRRRQRIDALQKASVTTFPRSKDDFYSENINISQLVDELTEQQHRLEKEISTLKVQRDQLQLMTSHHNCKYECNATSNDLGVLTAFEQPGISTLAAGSPKLNCQANLFVS